MVPALSLEQLLATASDLTWLMVIFYGPLLWVRLGLMVWQLYSRRHESICSAYAQSGSMRNAELIWGSRTIEGGSRWHSSQRL
jgi:hypothetical protein